MFQSKSRPIVVPQSEHLNMVATTVYSWGNDQFSLPKIDRDSLLKGVSLHDIGYGYWDTVPVGSVSPEQTVEFWRRCTSQQLSDPAAEIIIRRHFHRLAGWNKTSPLIHAFHEEMTAEIAAIEEEHHLDPKLFDFADSITNLCDTISYYFCFDEPKETTVTVYEDTEMTRKASVHVIITGNRTVTVAPWPFRSPMIEDFLFGYEREGYPTRTAPVVIPYRIIPGSLI